MREEGHVCEKSLRSLYIHIPFCREKCAYCDFLSVALKDYGDLRTYLSYLKKELTLYRGTEVHTIYVGGGTPSLIRPDDFFTFIQTLRNIFLTETLEEFSVEVNPESLSEEHIAVFLDSGVTRVSLGVQSFHSKVLERVGRCAGTEDVQKALLLLRDFRSLQLNVDLLMGIASPGIYRNDLKKTADLDPSHISVYMLEVSDRTPLNSMRKRGIFRELDSVEYEELYRYTHRFLAKRGYHHYEISNYAKPHCYSKHNMNYWEGGDYVGTGLGAVSTIGNERIYNFSRLESYYRALEKGEKPARKVEYLTNLEKNREIVMLGLRTKRGLDVGEIGKLCGEKCGEFSQYVDLLVKLGYVRKYGGRIFLTTEGMIRSNTIISGIWDLLSSKLE